MKHLHRRPHKKTISLSRFRAAIAKAMAEPEYKTEEAYAVIRHHGKKTWLAWKDMGMAAAIFPEPMFAEMHISKEIPKRYRRHFEIVPVTLTFPVTSSSKSTKRYL